MAVVDFSDTMAVCMPAAHCLRSPLVISFRSFLTGVFLLMAGGATISLRAQLPSPTYGYNIGNTLEPPCGEGCWGPPATEKLVEAIAKSGFNTVRLPVAWNSHADPITFQIDPAWMARVKEVVDWCYRRDLHVIINSHWDGGWLDAKITDRVDSSVEVRMRTYWTQIAMAFRDYDHRVLFAGTNEPPADTPAKMATLLRYHQTFVDAVRATGGGNTDRWLIVQGPGTDIDTTEKLMHDLPADPTPGRLAVEVHYYAPFQWCLMESDAEWGKRFFFWGRRHHNPARTDYNATWGEESYVDAQLQKMADKFVKRGIPVILGEFQAMKRALPKDFSAEERALHTASRVYFHRYIVASANEKGIKPIYWDIQGNLFDWTTGAVNEPENLDALVGK